MKNKIIFAAESIKVDYFYDDIINNQSIVYVFSPSYNRDLEGNNFGGEFFIKNGFDVVSFKITNDDWFQSIPLSVFENIKEINTLKKYKQKISYGSSMGGFGAIVFSSLLECNASIAFSPQFSIDENFDTRWECWSKNIGIKYRISKKSISKFCDYFIFYDNKSIDQLHIDRITALIPLEKIHLIKLPFAGHLTAIYLSEVSLIKNILIKIAKENNINDINLLINRKSSKTYLHSLSEYLLAKNKFKYSLDIINTTLSIDNNIGAYHLHKSIILARTDKFNESVQSLKDAIKLDPYFPSNHGYLTKLLHFLNDPEADLEAYRISNPIIPDSAVLLSHLSFLLSKQGLVSEALSAIRLAINLDKREEKFHLQECALLQHIESHLNY
jgi:tetratricopeptide (TPR) repeat protein